MRNYYSDSEPKQNNYNYSFEAGKIRPNEIKINVKYRIIDIIGTLSFHIKAV